MDSGSLLSSPRVSLSQPLSLPPQEPAESQLDKEGDRKPCAKSRVRNHEQRLDKIVKRATFEEKVMRGVGPTRAAPPTVW